MASPTVLFYPKDKVAFRCKRDRVPNDVWEREGLFQVTTGAIIDYRAPRQIRTSRRSTSNDGIQPTLSPTSAKTAATERLLELVLAGELARRKQDPSMDGLERDRATRIRPAT
ncbi:MAG TPA: hypothetical protein VKB47_05165 [Terracidiphilus sp.]|nr:hypothetical protein [Terracidiphilus sp.]